MLFVLLLGRWRVASFGDTKERWRRSGKVSPGRADVISPSLQSEPTRQDRRDAAVEEQGEVKRGVELPQDAVGWVAGAGAQRPRSRRLRYAL